MGCPVPVQVRITVRFHPQAAVKESPSKFKKQRMHLMGEAPEWVAHRAMLQSEPHSAGAGSLTMLHSASTPRRARCCSSASVKNISRMVTCKAFEQNTVVVCVL